MFAANSSQKADDKLYVDDVFSTYLYTGNGSTQTINNGIDLAGKGGLVWVKSRNTAENNALWACNLFGDRYLKSNNTDAIQSSGMTYLSNGFTAEAGFTYLNASGNTYASWTFRRAPKFFDVVTWTGNGTNNLIPHNLGIVPGFVIVKSTSTLGNWWVTARRSDGNYEAQGNLNLSRAFSGNNTLQAASWGLTSSTVNTNLLGAFSSDSNASGEQYVAYLFAHDPSPDGIIQCGSFTADASGNATVNTIGWEPQFAMVKAASATGDWIMLDTMRGWNLMANGDGKLAANLNAAETYGEYGNPTATGFEFKGGVANATYVYMVIRRPNKPPTSGTQVFKPEFASGIPPEAYDIARTYSMAMSKRTTTSTYGFKVIDRMRGLKTSLSPELTTSSTGAETTSNPYPTNLYNSSGGYDPSDTSMINYLFKRAPGFFDVVAYTGTGVASRDIEHGLGAIPELWIVKRRSGTGGSYGSEYTEWNVGISTQPTWDLQLCSTQAVQNNNNFWGNVSPTATTFRIGAASVNNATGNTYVAYLFASLPGIQWINSYVGDGTTGRVINCGFTTGARFVMVKATSTTGSWWIFDSARGIVSTADPALQLNSTAAEVTSADAIDPHSSGFIVNQEATCSLNASGVSYLVWAIA